MGPERVVVGPPGPLRVSGGRESTFLGNTCAVLEASGVLRIPMMPLVGAGRSLVDDRALSAHVRAKSG